jgi:tetratricopeptide (TPR) repeat protein
MTADKPAITGTRHELPFDKLSPRDFERLCMALLPHQGFENPHHYGAAGSERGRDIVAQRGGARWYVQCKRVKECGPQILLDEIEKVRKLMDEYPELRPAGMLFMVGCDVSATARGRAEQRCADLSMSCEVWGGTDLDTRLRPHRDILAEFFQLPDATAGEIDLGTALERLEALPLDDIPPIAPLPPGSRMPLSPNPLFVGREEDFKKLAECLKGGETVAIGQVQIAAATGLGGIGKTQLAAEFVHRYGQYFAGGVFWLSFADPAVISTEVAACGERGGLGLPTGFSSLPLEDQVRLVLSAWQSALPRLLVFDNCEEENLLAGWRPPTGGCRVLVTSRRGTWDRALGVEALPLGVLSRAESKALLRKFRTDLREDDAEAIADELGDLPLALHLAGSYLARYHYAVSPRDYLTQLRQPNPLAHRSLQRGGISPTKHAQHVAQTFVLSYERLDPDDLADSLALALLVRAAYFAPGQPIPRDLLRATLSEDVDLEAAEDGLLRLVALGLLEEQAESALVLHRLLAAAVRGVAADEGAQAAVEETIYVHANRLNLAGYPAPLLAWQAHLRTVTEAAWEREDRLAARLCSALDFHFGMIGEYVAALPYSERALAIDEKVLGPEHPDTARSLNNLGSLLNAMGDLAGARPYYERALAIYEKVLGPEHPYTRTVRDNLALLNDAE